MRIIYIGVALYNVVFVRGREDAGGMNAADSNDPKVYVRDVVAVFKPLLRLTPQQKNFTPSPPRRCAGTAQLYTRLCIYFSSLLTQSKQNINSSC